MIKRDNFTKEHIRSLQQQSHRDPALLERVVFAFGLLESLVRVGTPLIFKGGTSLILMMNPPRRLSTDIDIIVEPGTNLDSYIEEAAKIFPFKKAEEQIRIGRNNIEKRHFKFTYDSVIQNRQSYILLDVLFEENHYDEINRAEIRNELLLTEPEYLPVIVPGVDCILADKLTAFAPHTTGILLNTGKDMEVMKQFYDVSSLIDVFSDTDKVLSTYKKISEAETTYRGLTESTEDCLWDTFNASLCIASRGKTDSAEYPLYVKAIRDLRDHIYAENYTPEIAAGQAAKIMYLTMCLLTGEEFTSVEDYREFSDMSIQSDRLAPVRYLRKANPVAYAYVVKTDKLMR